MRRIIIAAALLACLAWSSEPETVETIESYSADGSVLLRLGRQEYRFSPETAEATGRGLIESASE